MEYLILSQGKKTRKTEHLNQMLIDTQATSLRCGNQLLDLAKPVVMGIINATPDSFYTPSRTNFNIQETLDMAQTMVIQGASILDIGGMSSRPGATAISEQEEIDRVLPAFEAIHKALPSVILSVDTYRGEVARLCISAGAGIINDISGGEMDPQLWHVVAEGKATYVLMHMRGTPATMQRQAQYDDLMKTLTAYFIEKLHLLSALGIHDVVIDPGFGFAKEMHHNYTLMANLNLLKWLGKPIMVGVSRKSTLSKTINRPVEETLSATTAMHMAALLQGASILRTHDVRAAVDTVEVYHQLNSAKSV
jgi:dihydropteroate synthase